MSIKKLGKLPVMRLGILLLAITATLMVGACPEVDLGILNQDTVAADFDISGLDATYDGQPKMVSISPKEGKSQGGRTTYYDGSTKAPSAAGSYAVTFDVVAFGKFNAANGLVAGTLVISLNQHTATPVAAADFDISGLDAIVDGAPKTVSITPQAGKTQGAITIYYNGDTDAPTDAGSYLVTFDVAAHGNFSAATGLIAGPLVISQQIANAVTPAAGDFDIGTLAFTYDGERKPVSITPKAGKSTGGRTIYYEGISPAVYAKSTTAPSAAGSYTVTFDVAAALGFNAASGLVAGTLTIGSAAPIADDFTITGHSAIYIDDNTAHAVIIAPKAGKSQGTRTIYYEGISPTVYDKSTDAPFAVGSYTVTFDVAPAAGFSAASGLVAGTLVISQQVANAVDPVKADFTIIGLAATYDGAPKEVSITPADSSKSQGGITVYYNGSETPPVNAGAYAVTFDVAPALGFNAKDGLSAGDLVISAATPVAADFAITGLPDAAINEGASFTINIAPIDNTKSTGAITIKYTPTGGGAVITSPGKPTAAGAYTVTFDVAAVAPNWNAAPGLLVGTLTINPPVVGAATPVATDFTITGFPTTAISEGASFTINIVPADSSKSQGAITIKYTPTSGGAVITSPSKPTAAGAYTVAFDVAAAPPDWNAAPDLLVGTLTIVAVPQGETTNYATTLTWGTSFTPTTLGLQPGNTTASINLNWYSSGNISPRVAHVRFIRGTITAGYELITVTNGIVASAGGSNYSHKATVSGLIPGASYVYAVSNNGTDWSPMYDFKVPPATGPFKFAVITDPQLTTGNVENVTGRYPAANVTTASGWLQTMQKVVDAGVSFIASAGDQVDSGYGGAVNETEYTNFFAPAGLRTLPFSPVAGNHDEHPHFGYHFNVPNKQTFAAEDSTPNQAGKNYFYLYNNILFVVLNTAPYPNGSYNSPVSVANTTAHIDRFRSTIQAAKTAHPNYDWLIVQHHKSTASVADHCADTDIEGYVRAGFEKLMSDEHVDLVLAGHDHVYARSYPLQGKDGGLVSLPDKSFPAASGSTWANPSDPIYLTFNTASGIKYYRVSADPYAVYGNTLYVQNNATYPYLGADSNGNATVFGGATYRNGTLPFSNAAFVQPYIPSYTIVDVNGKSITFKTYAIWTGNGTVSGKTPWSFDANVPYDVITVTKN